MPDVMKFLAKEDPFVPSVFEKFALNFIFTEMKKFDCVVCFLLDESAVILHFFEKKPMKNKKTCIFRKKSKKNCIKRKKKHV